MTKEIEKSIPQQMQELSEKIDDKHAYHLLFVEDGNTDKPSVSIALSRCVCSMKGKKCMAYQLLQAAFHILEESNMEELFEKWCEQLFDNECIVFDEE